MKKRKWLDPDDHPTPDLLLLHIEGELPSKDSHAAQEHLKICWTCRARTEEMNRGICTFVEYRDRKLIPNLPPPPSGWTDFPSRLLYAPHLAAGPLISLRKRLASYVTDLAHVAKNRRVRWTAAAVAMGMALILIFLPVASPPVVSASVLLDRARAAETNGLISFKQEVHQTIEIRHGSKVLRRQVVRGRAPLPQEPIATEWSPLLAGSPVDWFDPLGASGFASWREGLATKRESVLQSPDSLTLEVKPGNASSIEVASITVRASDWRATGKRVEFRNDPNTLEVREIAYEVRKIPVLDRAVSERTSARRPEIQPAGSVSPEVDLDESEILLHEILHRLKADVREAPEVWRTQDSIRFRFWPDTAERNEEILRETALVPSVVFEPPQTQLPPPDVLPTPGRQVLPASPLSDPPLLKPLWEYFGGVDSSNWYLNEVRDDYLVVLAEGSALQRLSASYPSQRLDRLAPELRMRVERLAADHAENLKSAVRAYVIQISPVLNYMMRANDVASAGEAASGSCVDWHRAADPDLDSIRQLHSSFTSLFVQKTGGSATPSAAMLLQQSDSTRSALLARIGSVCSSRELQQ